MQEAHVHEPFATVDYHLNSMFVLTCMLSVIRKANDPDFVFVAMYAGSNSEA